MMATERAFGTHPTDNLSHHRPIGSVVEESGNHYLAVSYRRMAGGSGTTGVDYTVDGMVYTVQYDADLSEPWSSGSVVLVGSPVDNGDGTETVTVRMGGPMSDAGKLFIRVRVAETP